MAADQTNAPSPLDEQTYTKLEEGLMKAFDRALYAVKDSSDNGNIGRAAQGVASCAEAIMKLADRKPQSLKMK